MRSGKGRAIRRSNSSFFISVPKGVFMDSMFPFDPDGRVQCKVTIVMDGNRRCLLIEPLDED